MLSLVLATIMNEYEKSTKDQDNHTDDFRKNYNFLYFKPRID